MLLTNIKQIERGYVPLKQCEITSCIDNALEKYPFQENQKSLIHINVKNKFFFQGNSDLFMHIIFNLLKNSLYQIQKHEKGDIYISTHKDLKYNYLTFKDTAEGVSRKELPYIFNKFYSKTPHGSGIGLAFCKLVMESFGGKITCEAEYGKYIEFKLIFPKE